MEDKAEEKTLFIEKWPYEKELDILDIKVKPEKIKIDADVIDEIIKDKAFLSAKYVMSFARDVREKSRDSQDITDLLLKEKNHPLYKEIGVVKGKGVLAFGRTDDKENFFPLDFFGDKFIHSIKKKENSWNYQFLLYFAKIKDPSTEIERTALMLKNGPFADNITHIWIRKKFETLELSKDGSSIKVCINKYDFKDGQWVNKRAILEETLEETIKEDFGKFTKYKDIIKNFIKKTTKERIEVPIQFIDLCNYMKERIYAEKEEKEAEKIFKKFRSYISEQYMNQRPFVIFAAKYDFPVLGTSLTEIDKGDASIISIGEVYEDKTTNLKYRKRMIYLKKVEEDISDIIFNLDG